MIRAHRGLSLIDVIVGVALFLVLFLCLFGVLRASLILSSLTKARAAAVELANTKIEYMRGISYDALGTVGGIPSGTLPQTATSTIDGVSYTVRTLVEYVDDPADGLGVNDTNMVTTDYKIGKVTVSYSLNGIAKSLSMVSNFVPPGIESSTGGGTLSLHIVNASGANVSGASVHIVNASTSPTINFTTYSNSGGFSIIGGAATSSEYQIYVSLAGYSSAQTYPRVGQNINPSPGYLTVVKNQTTSATFAIDLLSSLSLSTFSIATTTTFRDTFSNSSNIALQSNVQIAGGNVTLAPDAFSGSVQSISIGTSYLDGWGILSASLATPAGTNVLVHVADGSGNLLPDAALSGNSAGFSSFPVMLTGISTTTYPSLRITADLSTNSTSTTPVLSQWSISHTEGPTPLPNVAYTLTGAKTIGTDANSAPLYKTTVSGTTDSSGKKTETLEWDSYTLTIGSGTVIESCVPSPYALVPGMATTSAIIIGTPSTNRIPIIIENSASSTVPNAKVVLTSGSYAATIPASSCGMAYFNGLSAGTYTATVSAAGYTTTTFPNISVSGNTAATTLTLP